MYAIDLPPDSFSVITQQVLITSYIPGIISGVDEEVSPMEINVSEFRTSFNSLILQLIPNFKNKYTKKTSRNIQSFLKWVYSNSEIKSDNNTENIVLGYCIRIMME